MLHAKPPQPKAPKGFDHVTRYWDGVHNTWAAKILPGEFYVSTHGEMIVTVLGSCVAACIRDKKTRDRWYESLHVARAQRTLQ